MSKEYKASEIAQLINGTLKGCDVTVNGVNSLKMAEEGNVSFEKVKENLVALP